MPTLQQIKKRLDQKSGKKKTNVEFERVDPLKVTTEMASKVIKKMEQGMEKPSRWERFFGGIFRLLSKVKL